MRNETVYLRMPHVWLEISDGPQTERYPEGHVVLTLCDQTGAQDVNLTAGEVIELAAALLTRARGLSERKHING